MGGKPRRKPKGIPLEVVLTRVIEVFAVKELCENEDRKFIEYMKGIENGR